MGNIFSQVVNSWSGVQSDALTAIMAMLAIGLILLGMRFVIRAMNVVRQRDDSVIGKEEG